MQKLFDAADPGSSTIATRGRATKVDCLLQSVPERTIGGKKQPSSRTSFARSGGKLNPICPSVQPAEGQKKIESTDLSYRESKMVGGLQDLAGFKTDQRGARTPDFPVEFREIMRASCALFPNEKANTWMCQDCVPGNGGSRSFLRRDVWDNGLKSHRFEGAYN